MPDPRVAPAAACLFACLHRPPGAVEGTTPDPVLAAIAQEFSPRHEVPRADLVTIDVSGLDRLLGPPAAIGAELAREAERRGVRAHIAIAATHTAAAVLARWRPGITIVERGRERAAVAPIPIGMIDVVADAAVETVEPSRAVAERARAGLDVSALKRWGIRTLGELAALPPAELVARLGRTAIVWQAIARGEDTRPLAPAVAEERFDASIELDWPIEGLEPLSFVLTRLLEPLSMRLERRDRGAAVLHVILRLAGEAGPYARRLELPTPIRDVRTLRTLALLDLESHPPNGPIERVRVAIDPTPGRVLQHTLFERAHPTPEQLSTLLARLGALMGQDRIGAAAAVDSYRPGAFAMKPFPASTTSRGSRPAPAPDLAPPPPASVLRRCRQPVPARVAIDHGRPVRVTTDRRGFAGGAVTHTAGPWRTSGNWWDRAPLAAAPCPTQSPSPASPSWDRDEWDVALSDGGVYRIFHERDIDRWFIEGIVD